MPSEINYVLNNSLGYIAGLPEKPSFSNDQII